MLWPFGVLLAVLVLLTLPALAVYRRRLHTADQDGHEPAMLAYIVRRLLYAIPILIGVNLLTFALFFVVNTPGRHGAHAARA